MSSNNHGGKRQGAGRKPKEVEQNIKALTDPYTEEAVKAIVGVMKTAKRDADVVAAAKVLLEYSFGKPKQQSDVDIKTNGKEISISSIEWTK